jgi:hypothetical protein
VEYKRSETRVKGLNGKVVHDLSERTFGTNQVCVCMCMCIVYILR